jgi:outer membrane protein OmpA-like peptidoglycan-associated protein
MTKDIDLYPLKGGKTRLLIFFDFDKFDLKDESRPELERVIEFLKDNPEIKVRIEGHTDDVGTDDYNDKLSQNRANAVKQYIVSAGIDGSRISTKGFGKRQPLVKDKTEEARAMNRRVEMKILE